MADCECPGHSNVFSDRTAEADLRRYLREGPDRSTRILTDAIRAEGITNASVLDIGGGVGVIPLELLAAGAATARSVDASPAFVAVARRETERRGLADRIVHHEGDFVALSPSLPAADVVTLVRAVCCYGPMPALIGRSTEHARRMIGLVYPRDTWWSRWGAGSINLGYRLVRDRFRFYVHAEREMDALIRGAGFERRFLHQGLFWQIALYVRLPSVGAQP